MSNKRTIRRLIVLVALFLVVPMYLNATVHRVLASGTQYYIDSNDGSDTNCNGKSSNEGSFPNCPWQTFQNVNTTTFQPDDQILLEDGGTWAEPSSNLITHTLLHPLGSGSIGHPIVLKDYTGDQGTNLPLLNGVGDKAAVGLENQQSWEISNLEITNLCNQGCSPASRKGVWVYAHDVGTLHHIYLSKLTIHDVSGLPGSYQDPKAARVSGGIIFEIANLTGTPTNFDDVHVTGNIVHDVYRNGIFFFSPWQGSADNGKHPCHVGKGNFSPSTHVLVDSNQVYTVGGNGIAVEVGVGEQLSNNVVYNGQQDGTHSVAIWSFDSNGAIIEGNLVYGWQFHGATGNLDATAFDTDDCDLGTIIQYNFSHDNQGGFLLAVDQSANTVVRYNISERDGYGDSAHPRDFLINNTYTGTGDGMRIYNNDIYMDDANHSSLGTGLIQNESVPFVTKPIFANNLIESLQAGQNTTCAIPSVQTPTNTDWLVGFNDFYAGTAPSRCASTAPVQMRPINGDPLLASPGSGYSANWKPGVIAAYTLQSGSPALCKGAPIPNNGGVDFAGNTLPSNYVDAGALEQSSSC